MWKSTARLCVATAPSCGCLRFDHQISCAVRPSPLSKAWSAASAWPSPNFSDQNQKNSSTSRCSGFFSRSIADRISSTTGGGCNGNAVFEAGRWPVSARTLSLAACLVYLPSRYVNGEPGDVKRIFSKQVFCRRVYEDLAFGCC